MVKKLSEDARYKIERPNVTIELTINPQHGATDVPEARLPALSAELNQSLATLSERLCAKAEEIADKAEALANRVSDEPSNTMIAKHCEAAKISIDSNGSSVYLRALITSTRRVPQTVLSEFVAPLMSCFRELAAEMIKASEFKATFCGDNQLSFAAMLACLSLTAYGAPGRPGTDEPQLGDRA